MSKNYTDELIDIINRNVEIQSCTPESKMEELGFSSYKFIKFVVEVEDAFDIEFDDDFLDFEKFIFVKDLITYIESCNR